MILHYSSLENMCITILLAAQIRDKATLLKPVINEHVVAKLYCFSVVVVSQRQQCSGLLVDLRPSDT